MIKNNLDVVLAAVGALLSLVVAFYLYMTVGRWLYVSVGVLAFLACGGYLVIRRKWDIAASPVKYNSHLPRMLDVAFVLLFASSICVYMLREESYERPLAYFVLIAVASAVVAAKIVCMPTILKNALVTFIQIVLIGLSLEWTVSFLYPSIIGIDPWVYQVQVGSMMNGGEINYRALLLMQWIVTGTSIITGLGYKLATMVSVSLISVVADAVFVYLMGKSMVNAKVGLLGALLVVTANWHIFFEYWTIPNTLGLTLVLSSMYLALRYYKTKSWVMLSTLVISMGALLYTHPIASIWLLLLLMACMLGVLFYRWAYRVRISLRPTVLVMVVYIVMLLSWWGLGTGHLQSLQYMVELEFNQSRLGFPNAPGLETFGYPALESVSNAGTGVLPPSEQNTGGAETTTPSSPLSSTPSTMVPLYRDVVIGESFGETSFNCGGMFLFFAIAIIGCLLLLSKRYINEYSIAWVGSSIGILAISFFPMLYGRSVIEHRWWFFAEALMSIPLAVVLIGIPKWRLGCVGCVVGILVLLMSVGLPANMDNRTFSPNQLVRYAFTSSEIEAVGEVMGNYGGKVGMDNYYTYTGYIFPEYKDRMQGITQQILAANFGECNVDIILIRDEVIYHPIGVGDGHIYRLVYDPRRVLLESGYSIIYQNDDVIGLKRP